VKAGGSADRSPANGQVNARLVADVELFLAQIDRDELSIAVAARTREPMADVREKLDMYLNETRVGARLLSDVLAPGMRVLEVGCGIGALAIFLAEQGCEVTAIEPGGEGFGFMPAALEALRAMRPDSAARFYIVGAEQLTVDEHGQFDVVFSVNVVEHVDDIAGVLEASLRTMAAGGRCVHMTPNYTVPYEPHFGIPLLPLFPRLTERLLPDRIAKSDLWHSLNFITARKVRRIASSLEVSVSFRRGIAAEMMERVMVDEQLRERHPLLAKLVHLLRKVPFVTGMLARVPPGWMTPMVFELRRAGLTDQAS